MDDKTISTYNQEAKDIAELHSTLIPTRIYELISTYFIKNSATVDIGCGIGRDTDWLHQQGFPVIGIDASEGMLIQAKKYYPHLLFNEDSLPELNTLKQDSFKNILCSAVLMHLIPSTLAIACRQLISLLQDDGCLIISFRGSHEIDHRENGKLYEPIDIAELQSYFTTLGCSIALHESEFEENRKLTWHNLVIKK